MAPIDWISRPIVAEGTDENGNHYSISRMEALEGAEYSVFRERVPRQARNVPVSTRIDSGGRDPQQREPDIRHRW